MEKTLEERIDNLEGEMATLQGIIETQSKSIDAIINNENQFNSVYSQFIAVIKHLQKRPILPEHLGIKDDDNE